MACTRWALDSGTSQSGRVEGTSTYSCKFVREEFFFSKVGERTPLTRSKIIRIATQNSSKSRLPSLSTSARSQTLSSWSSRSWLFLSTEAA